MADCISYRDTTYFSELITDYLDEKDTLTEFYGNFPSLKNFNRQLQEKSTNYTAKTRQTLVEAVQKQHANVATSPETVENINLLRQENTFTITTGHQLNLFTGPLYFLYKIISTLKLCKQLSEAYPKQHFVPIYWMATEDHDFEEINFFNFKNKKIQWETQSGNAVGRLKTTGFEKAEQLFSEELNASENAKYLQELFHKTYQNHNTLSEATRFLVNELFGKYGLVIIDADKASLKNQFLPYVKKELLQQNAYQAVTKTTQNLSEKGYAVQVNPREINLFYFAEGTRHRIIKEDSTYLIHETEIRFSEAEIIAELNQYPERFSPNVIMRPLYQEVILPNLCYIGGGGELAYWFQLKSYFEAEKISFPILLLRNSALLISEKQQRKLKNLSLSVEELFLPQDKLLSRHTEKISNISIDFSSQKKHLQQQFEDLYQLATKTDKSFVGAVAAQEKKQLKGLEHLEKRLRKAQKRKLADELKRVEVLQNQLFPNQNLQERVANFSTFYEVYGNSFIDTLYKSLAPLTQEFAIVKL